MQQRWQSIYKKVIGFLIQKLPPHLTYHNVAHTIAVIEKTILIATAEKVSPKELKLLKIAALYHDSGFVVKNRGHELESCKKVRKELPAMGFSSDDISIICGMIMATRLPQKPRSRLEMILADADLEYLGTNRFEEIGNTLLKEMTHYEPNFTLTDWNNLQITFLKQHHFFTSFCKKNRQPKKEKNLKMLLKKCA
jgi:uncharacterized protein